jgi:hypothetical protein
VLEAAGKFSFLTFDDTDPRRRLEGTEQKTT